ncbi:MAG: hypothetical protein CM1200mP2_03630 [Planctomycetaceae bacterium]|nr:MAG: hypothetical protein CM1200mP2_03630 [Planctomycetaceae bacterium]
MSRSRWAVALRALLILIAWSTWMSEDFSPFDPSDRPKPASTTARPRTRTKAARSSSPSTASSPPAIPWRPRRGSTSSKRGQRRRRSDHRQRHAGTGRTDELWNWRRRFVIYWDNKTKTLYGLNGSGRSPHSISRKIFQDKGLDEIPINGPLSWSVPGCVDGWEMVRKRFGTLGFKDLLADPIKTAQEGFPVFPKSSAAAGPEAGPPWPSGPTRPVRISRMARRPASARSSPTPTWPGATGRSPNTAEMPSTPGRSPAGLSPSARTTAVSSQ